MKRMILALAVLSGPARSAPDRIWFTITGNPEDPAAETIQMDPRAEEVDGARRTMAIRVNRSQMRTSGDGIDFRSFEGSVEFDCQSRSARFTRSQFFSEPLWQGPGPVRHYPATDVRPMEFRRFDPNPRDRVILAACRAFDSSRTHPGR